ncbi:hypothetical protein H0H87_008754 [Tephrocybe sp. NHM501043]|nr:hypothetical protein H0H87_008754 [Tephrocybe sp. NHM501043]
MTVACVAFQERFMRKQTQLHAVLEAWANVLRSIFELILVYRYYKEAIAGETKNYISNRAFAEAKAPLQIASDIRVELVSSRKIIYEILASNEDPVQIWRAFERGYM